MTKFKALIGETVSWPPEGAAENPKAMDPQHRKSGSEVKRYAPFYVAAIDQVGKSSRSNDAKPCLARLSTISKDHYDIWVCLEMGSKPPMK